jgi:hypothetical protein
VNFHIRHILIVIILALTLNLNLEGQLSSIDDDNNLYQVIDRATTIHPSLEYHTAVHYGSRLEVLKLTAQLDTMSWLSKLDRVEWRQAKYSVPERRAIDAPWKTDMDTVNRKAGFLGAFYKDPYTFWEVNVPDFFLAINPVLNLSMGNSDGGKRIFQNTRGIKIRGVIDQKIYFYSSLYETQRRYPSYIDAEIDRINAIPGQGFYKLYDSSILGGISGYDFLNGQAYAGTKISKSIDLQFGHGRHFIGDGIRSLLLSDYSHNYFYLRLSTKIWKFHYQNIFAELAAASGKDAIGNELLPKKYMSAHYLDFEVSDRLTIGLFESVIYGRDNGLELQYLNPVILYRTVEQMLDSPDNVLLGLNIKWIPRKRWQLYGQLMVDELKTSQAFNGSGWWGNKIAYQVGTKIFNVLGVDHLDIQIEHNTARPYTYAHRINNISDRPVGSYSHYNQSLAHPYGANFRETIFQVRYRPSAKIWVDARYIRSYYGDDLNGQNFGRNILEDYETRTQDFENETGQGLRRDINIIHGSIAYELMPNTYLDLNLMIRRQSTGAVNNPSLNYIGLGLRMNMGKEDLDF